MEYDKQLAMRIRRTLSQRKGITEKEMFGGLAFLLHGKMCCRVVKNDLVARVGPDYYKQALTKPSVRPMDFTGRPLKGWVYVNPEGQKTDNALKKWIELGVVYAASLRTK